MKVIKLSKFGTVLISRPAGLESFNAIRSDLDPKEGVALDFEGVLTVTPSWFDEFLTNLGTYMEGNVELLPTQNASVLASLPILVSARDDVVADIVRRAIEKMPQS